MEIEWIAGYQISTVFKHSFGVGVEEGGATGLRRVLMEFMNIRTEKMKR